MSVLPKWEGAYWCLIRKHIASKTQEGKSNEETNVAKTGGIVEMDFEKGLDEMDFEGVFGLFMKDTCWKCAHTRNWQLRNNCRCEQYERKPYEVFECGEKCPNFQQVESIEGQPEDIKELENKIEELRRIIPQGATMEETLKILFDKLIEG